jgi:hypothetical protein
MPLRCIRLLHSEPLPPLGIEALASAARLQALTLHGRALRTEGAATLLGLPLTELDLEHPHRLLQALAATRHSPKPPLLVTTLRSLTLRMEGGADADELRTVGALALISLDVADVFGHRLEEFMPCLSEMDTLTSLRLSTSCFMTGLRFLPASLAELTFHGELGASGLQLLLTSAPRLRSLTAACTFPNLGALSALPLDTLIVHCKHAACRLAGLERLPLTRLHVYFDPGGRPSLACLAGLPLTDLLVSGDGLPSSILRHLAGMPLCDLALDVGGVVTATDLRVVTQLPLKYLSLRCEHLSEGALALLPPTIRELALVAPTGLTDLHRAARWLEHLKLEATALTAAMCKELESLPALQYLDVADAETHLCAAELAALARRIRVVTCGEKR